jgi:hypothetical protein
LKSEDFIANLKPLVVAKKAELEKSEYAKMIDGLDTKDAATQEAVIEPQASQPPDTKEDVVMMVP